MLPILNAPYIKIGSTVDVKRFVLTVRVIPPVATTLDINDPSVRDLDFASYFAFKKTES